MSKLSNVVDSDVVKKIVYDRLVAPVILNDTSEFVSKTQHKFDKIGIEKKTFDVDKEIPGTKEVVKKTVYNAKVIEIEGKMCGITTLATTSVLHTQC